MTEQIGPVCSPAIAQSLRDGGDPGAAAFLARHPLLHTKTRLEAWPSWARLSGLRLMPGREQTFEHFYFSLQAAAAGLGVAIGPWTLVRQDIAAGILVAPFGFLEDGSAYHLLSPHPPGSDRRIAALLEWLRDQSR
jgi:LysR family glycine cleavage system transcriptional activator